MSPVIRTWPLRAPTTDRRAEATGVRRANGLPRFVMMMGLPVAATRSINSRHLALNSAAPTVSFRIYHLTMNMVRC
jgi:hypothetical protein